MKSAKSVVSLLGVAGLLVVPASVGQPVYSDPPCPEPGNNCDYTNTPGKYQPTSNSPWNCPECIYEMSRSWDNCTATPGTGNTEFCGWDRFENFPRYFQQFRCVQGIAMEVPVCNFDDPIGSPLPSALFDMVRTYRDQRPCPNGDCLNVD